jgi:hypothetical protein
MLMIAGNLDYSLVHESLNDELLSIVRPHYESLI